MRAKPELIRCLLTNEMKRALNMFLYRKWIDDEQKVSQAKIPIVHFLKRIELETR